jgi:hypothetical protein
MTIQEARKLVGQTVTLQWTDRNGKILQGDTYISKADYVPMYGPCLTTDFGDVHMDKIQSAELVAVHKAA